MPTWKPKNYKGDFFKNDKFLQAMAINSFFATIGSSNQVHPYNDLASLAADFDITKFSNSPTTKSIRRPNYYKS